MAENEKVAKAGLFLIVFGLIMGGIGAAAAFLVSSGLIWIFYVGFFLMIMGFIVALLSKA